MKKIDYALKGRLIKDGTTRLVSKIDRNSYFLSTEQLPTSRLSKAEYEELTRLFSLLDEEIIKEARRINASNNIRLYRLKNFIQPILENSSCDCLFLTLTFNDTVLTNTTKETRRKYVRRFLHSFSKKYVANIDYGGKKGREHYHAVVDSKIPLEKIKEWHSLCGALKLEDVKRNVYRKTIPKKYKNLPEDVQDIISLHFSKVRLSKYLSKLTNHAIKKTNRRSVLIYSRKAV